MFFFNLAIDNVTEIHFYVSIKITIANCLVLVFLESSITTVPSQNMVCRLERSTIFSKKVNVINFNIIRTSTYRRDVININPGSTKSRKTWCYFVILLLILSPSLTRIKICLCIVKLDLIFQWRMLFLFWTFTSHRVLLFHSFGSCTT